MTAQENTQHGKKGYFGTTLDETLGFIIESGSINAASQKATFADGYGRTVGVTSYDEQYTGTLSGKMLNSTDAAAKRAAVAIGAALALPTLPGIATPFGLCITESYKADHTNTNYATFEISYTIYPYIAGGNEQPA